MQFDFENLPEKDRYRLLCSFVAPRPVALVTTCNKDGLANAAPMSFFNVFAQDPPIVILGIQMRSDGSEKDTTANIRNNSEFVINLCDLAIAQQMVDCGHPFDEGVDEIAITGLTHKKSLKISPPWIAEAPAAMECRVAQIIEYPRRLIILGEVVQMHVRDECLDPEGYYVRPDVYQPIARLHSDNYIVADNQFVLTESFNIKGQV
jgi:flavin reductase (DIM6/NTAB) family NADH-FMN oxidoreductase RutF